MLARFTEDHKRYIIYSYKEKTKSTKKKIFSINSQVAKIEERIFEVKSELQIFNKKSSDDYEILRADENAVETCDLSFNFKKNIKRRAVSTNPLTNGTASGGILQSFTKNKEPLMPQLNINSELYCEDPTVKIQEDESIQMMFNSSLERIGCCNSNFFCF